MSSLACADRPLRERLHAAATYNLSHVPVADLPEHVRTDFQKAWEEMTAVEAHADEGTIKASITAAPVEKLADWAETVVATYAAAEQELGRLRGG